MIDKDTSKQILIGVVLLAVGGLGGGVIGYVLAPIAKRISETQLHEVAGYIVDDPNYLRVFFSRMEESGKFRPNAADWKVRAGETRPDQTSWQPRQDTRGRWRGLSVTVDTSSGKFKSVPLYFASITSGGAAWGVTSAVYDPKVTSFDFWVMFHSDAEGAFAVPALKELKWTVRWLGVEQ